LLSKHQISDRELSKSSQSNQTAQTSSIAKSVLQQQLQAAQQRPPKLTIDAILRALVQWIVVAHIALSCVEKRQFQELLQLLNPLIFSYIYTAGNSIRRFILNEFQQRRLSVINDLQNARSKIHLSFDLWSSPNSLALCGVVAHYVTADLTNRALLLGLKRVQGTHSGENIADAILKVTQEFKIADKIGYFQANNAGNNDTCIRTILNAISPDSDPSHCRMRCYGHVINLAAKAFLFGDDPVAFELEIENAEKLKLEIRHEQELLMLWRKRGSVGKLHNLILWIRRSPQRRQAFREASNAADKNV
jgi:hypothetical protein